jgi:excisionase family DNA binding protein
MKNCITDKKQEPQYLKLEEVSSLLNMKVSRIRNMIFKDQIPHIKVGASIRFNKADVLAWYESKARGGLK